MPRDGFGGPGAHGTAGLKAKGMAAKPGGVGTCSDDPSSTAWCPSPLQVLSLRPGSLFPSHKTVKGSEPALPRTPVKVHRAVSHRGLYPERSTAAITPRRCQPARDLRQDQHQCSGCHRDLNTQVPHGAQRQDLRAALGSGGTRSRAAMAAWGRGCVTVTVVWLPRGARFTRLQPIMGTHTHKFPPSDTMHRRGCNFPPRWSRRRRQGRGRCSPGGTGTWLCSPRLSAKPSPRLHTPFFKAG